MKILAFLLTIALAFISAAPAFAFRCGPGGKYIASEGMHKYKVLNDCGQPISRETVGADYGGGSYRYVEEWVYVERGSGGHNFLYLIKFDKEGRAGEIKYLGEQR